MSVIRIFVSLHFDINDQKERNISRRKISLYMDTARSKILICHAVSHLMKCLINILEV